MGFPAGVCRDFAALERRRMRAARLLAKGLSQSEVARRVGAHRQSVSRWAAELHAKGLAGLRKAGRAGRKPRLSAEQLNQIERGLKRGPQALGYETSLWTANRVVHLIEQECGVSYHPGHVWKILRRLGWSCQRPAGRALERDEKAIQRWKKERWPELKKRPKSGPDHSFHRRERAQRAAPSLPHLGAAGADPGAAIPLQLENSVGDGGCDVVELLLSALSRRHQKSASGRVPPPSDAPSAGQAADHLGRPAQSSQPPGVGLCPPTARSVKAGIPSRLCSRTQSGGVSVVALETTRTTQLLPEHLRAAKRPCASRAQADASTHFGDGFLGASPTVSLVSILCEAQ